MKTSAFDRLSAVAAFLVGIVALLYAVAFVVLRSDLGASLLLMVSGLLVSVALTGLYDRLRDESPFALLAFVLGIVGAIGAAAHGGYDLANDLHPPGANAIADLPSQVDPRGLLTFGIAGISLLFNAGVIAQSKQFHRGLGMLGYLLGILLIIIYLGRLIIVSPTNPLLLYPVLISGFIVNPLWYLWLGMQLGRKRP